jgi:hypothetical protein
MADATGEAKPPPRVAFDRRLKLEFHGARITSDGGLLACRELDDALGLTTMGVPALAEGRRGRNIRHRLLGLLRQAVDGRLAGSLDQPRPQDNKVKRTGRAELTSTPDDPAAQGMRDYLLDLAIPNELRAPLPGALNAVQGLPRFQYLAFAFAIQNLQADAVRHADVRDLLGFGKEF